ncbi:uncharacterized protein LOC133175011 [Saccostrea echinata]|uniref:uncharacterized protein LOC133175011 n=1 Tax=Saccostrea echinata TaxID=191078 RepID=UPI002A7FEDBE|nr:uncharacterized protein LOC133175011 [Saccostrea echinata]
MKSRLETHPEIYDILAMSKCILVDHTVDRFQKTMEVQFTMDNVISVDPDDPNYELAFFYWENGIAKRASGKNIKRKNGNYLVEVDHFSGVSCALVRRNAKMSPLEPYLVYGMIHTCTLLIFIKRRKEDMLSLWCECAKREMARTVAEKRIKDHDLEEIDCSHSKDIFVREGQRIRIDVNGSVQFVREIPKSFYLLTFIPVAEDNHIYFPLQKNIRMGSVPYAVINFSADNQKKQLLHSVHFDPWVKSASALKKYYTDIAIYNRPNTSKTAHTDPGPTKTPRSPRKVRLQVNNGLNTAAQCVRDWFDNEKNLLAIANQIPVNKLVPFGIHLCIRSEDINRLKKEYKENEEELQFFFIKFWARRVKSYLKPEARLEQLTKAMSSIGLQKQAEVVKRIFKSKDDLNSDHFSDQKDTDKETSSK